MANGPFYDIGPHIGQITNQAITYAKTGTAQLLLRVKVLGVPEGDGYAPLKQQYERSIYMALTEKTAPFVLEKLAHIGFIGDISQLDPSSPNFQSLAEIQVDLWCGHEKGQDGVLRERWGLSSGSSAMKEYTPPSTKQAKELDAIFGRAKRQLGIKSTPTNTPNSGINPDITDDDIPF